jgi:hypothetical protein
MGQDKGGLLGGRELPAQDIYHNEAKHALINDGWTITDDPYFIKLWASILIICRGWKNTTESALSIWVSRLQSMTPSFKNDYPKPLSSDIASN